MMGIKKVRPCVKIEEEVSELPLPLQIIVRGIQSLTAKYSDGADLEVVHTETALEARILRRKLLLEYNKDHEELKVMFEKYGEGYFFTKCVLVKCDMETAKDIIHYVRLMLCDAIDTFAVKVPDSLLSLFSAKAEAQETQQETQTA